MILTHAYIRRKQWEANVTAAAVVNRLAEAMNEQEEPGPIYGNNGVSTPTNGRKSPGFITLADGRRARVVAPEVFLSTVKQR